ncbi:TRAP transporter small permease subunit [Microvirga alba]|uniref:TRAP transporter small permease protein n=1 Tax=Microvirga alba TaxID=2791025 RepID=A0A931BN03_9HYPH|nr:TRAP transporter small permease subunit [Microvirga alba]MBF9234117.1 TRAP transporter small permease subunit [Microvirga alba]
MASNLSRFTGGMDRVSGAVVSLGRWLALPVMTLLFIQWPLRDFVKAYSREANDLGQWLFAIFVAVSVTAATRARAHLAADAFAKRYSPDTRLRIKRVAIVFVLMPWAGFVLVTGWPLAWSSLLALESFSETNNPGYFLIKAAVMLLALLMMIQGIVSFCSRDPGA